MLKKIPKSLSPQLVKTLMEMGHGDEIVLGDANFPSSSVSSNVIRADGLSGAVLLEAILELFPLDSYADPSVILMEVVPGDDYKPRSGGLQGHSGASETLLHRLPERFDFYERAKKAYAVVATGEEALYANIILKKGVVR